MIDAHKAWFLLLISLSIGGSSSCFLLTDFTASLRDETDGGYPDADVNERSDADGDSYGDGDAKADADRDVDSGHDADLDIDIETESDVEPVPQATGKLCVAQSGGGGIPCTTNAECETNPYVPEWTLCVSGRCVECIENNDCSSGDGSTAYCGPYNFCNGCVDDWDCVGSGLGNRCQDICRECLVDDDCVAGPGNTGKCTEYFICRRCDVDEDCLISELGVACNIETHRCLECLTDADCEAGVETTPYCVENRCQGCFTMQDCEDAGIVTVSCECTDTRCPEGEVCTDAGSCEPE